MYRPASHRQKSAAVLLRYFAREARKTPGFEARARAGSQESAATRLGIGARRRGAHAGLARSLLSAGAARHGGKLLTVQRLPRQVLPVASSSIHRWCCKQPKHQQLRGGREGTATQHLLSPPQRQAGTADRVYPLQSRRRAIAPPPRRRASPGRTLLSSTRREGQLAGSF